MLQQSLIQRNKPQSKKQRFFRLFHTLLLHHNIHINLYVILLLLEIMQMVYYACHTSFQRIWPDKATQILQLVLSFTDLSGLWRIAGGTSVIIFAAISMIVNIVASVLVLYEVFKDPILLQEVNLLTIKFLSYYFIFLRTFLVLPMVLAFSCFISPSLYGLSVPSQAILGVISGVGMLFLIFNCVLSTLLYRDNSPFSKLEFSSSVNNLDELRLVIKIFLGLYGSMAQKGTVFPLIFGGIYLFLLMISIYFLRSRFGMTNYPYNRIYELGIVLPFWTLLATLAQVLGSPTQAVGLILWIVGMIIFPFAWGYIQSRIQLELLTTHYKSLMTSNQYLAYNYSCIRLANNRQDPNNLTLLEGILSIHIQDCKKPPELCVCSRVRSQLLGRTLEQSREQIEQQTQLWYQFIRNNLLEVSDKYQTSPEIWFLLAYIENDILNNKFRSLHSLEQAMNIPSGIKFEMLSYHHLRKVQIKMIQQDKIKNQKKSVDINKFFKFQMNFCKLQQLIEESTYQHAAFWELLKSDKASRHLLYVEGQKVIIKLNQIKSNYEKLMHLNSYNLYCMILYANFMKVVVNSGEIYDRSQETIEMAKRSVAQNFKIQKDVEKQKYGDNSISAIIIISGERKNIGVIKHSTSKVVDIIGYTPHQLLGQNINIIMPKFIGNMHDDVLRNYLELSQSQHDYVERIVPMMDLNNFMVLGRVLSKPFPNLINGLELIGIFNSVAQSSLNHPQQKPKYVLYRSDTGQVQALSESCFTEFNYKINKIDEYHQTSSQLTFNTLFIGLKQQDMIDGKKVKSKALSKCQNSSDYEEVSVQVFQKLLIHYYSVNLRLLCFYTNKNYKDVESIREFMPDSNNIEFSLLKDNQFTKTSNINMPKTSKEKFLHEMSKKQNVVVNEPLPLKILKIWGFGYLILMLVLAIVILIIHMNKQYIKDYQKIIKYQGQVVGNVCETAINGRLKQMTLYYPNDLPSVTEIDNNLNTAISSVQQAEISADQLYLNYGDFSSLSTKQYTYGSSKVVVSMDINLNNHIFDYVTVTSSLKSIPQAALNFPLQIFQTQTVGSPTTILFKTRYNSLFSILPAQAKFKILYNQIFNSLFESEKNKSALLLGVALLSVVIVFIIAIILALSVVTTTDLIMLMFGHMSHSEVQKQIENCNSFLQVFYQDSYMIKLKNRQKMKDNINNNQNINQRAKKEGVTSRSNKSVLQNPYDPSSARANVSKIQFMEKELHLRTEAELLVSQTEQENENHLLRGGGSVSDQNSIYEKLEAENDGCKMKFVAIYLLLISFFGGYFVQEYFSYRASTTEIQQHIQHYQLIYANINSLKLMRLYALQTYIDNGQFETYSLLNTYLTSIYSQLYANQRNLDQISYTSNGRQSFSYNYKNICDPNVINQLSSVPNMKYYQPSSFSASQCSSLLRNALSQGSRLATVSYTETLLNISRANILTSNFSLSKYGQIMKIQKYLEAPLLLFGINQEQVITKQMSTKHTLSVIKMVIFSVLTLILFVLVWLKSLNKLMERLTTTRIILGFIPVRVFVHNSKLTKEYQAYIGELIS